jgi:hypothetical protein
MALSAEFDTRTDRIAYNIVAVGAAALSYYHARTFFWPFMGRIGATVTPLMLDAVVYWLITACVRQARKGRPLPMLRVGAYLVISLSIAANALGGATLWERVFMALPAGLFGYLTEMQIRLALYHYRAENGDGRITLLLWIRHPIRSMRATLWLARKSVPAFDVASGERDQVRAARDAVRIALPGRSTAMRRARAGVLRELAAGRLSPADAVHASGLLSRAGVPELHRAALASALGGTSHGRLPAHDTNALRTEIADMIRTEVDAVREALRTEIAAMRAALRTEARVDRGAPSSGEGSIVVDRRAIVLELADEIRNAISGGERWTPDYAELKKRTGFGRSWCEKAVRDARALAFSVPRSDGDARTDDGKTDDQPRTEGSPRAGRLELVVGAGVSEAGA